MEEFDLIKLDKDKVYILAMPNMAFDDFIQIQQQVVEAFKSKGIEVIPMPFKITAVEARKLLPEEIQSLEKIIKLHRGNANV